MSEILQMEFLNINNIIATDISGMLNIIAIYLLNLNIFLNIQKYYVKFNAVVMISEFLGLDLKKIRFVEYILK